MRSSAPLETNPKSTNWSSSEENAQRPKALVERPFDPGEAHDPLRQRFKEMAEAERRLKEQAKGAAVKKRREPPDDDTLTDAEMMQHMRDLERVFSKLISKNMKANPKKCKMFNKEADFLGHIVRNGKRSIPPKSTKAIRDFEVRTYGDLASFVGLMQHFAKYLQRAQDYLQPLRDLYHGKQLKQHIEMSKEIKELINAAKQQCAHQLSLYSIDYNKKIYIVCDASSGENKNRSDDRPGAYCAILYQLENDEEEGSPRVPIEFLSKTFTKQQMQWAINDKELYSILQPLIQWERKLSGHHVTVYNDHANLVTIVRNMYLSGNPRTQRMVQWLSTFNVTLKQVKGKDNIADYLTRTSKPTFTGCLDILAQTREKGHKKKTPPARGKTKAQFNDPRVIGVDHWLACSHCSKWFRVAKRAAQNFRNKPFYCKDIKGTAECRAEHEQEQPPTLEREPPARNPTPPTEEDTLPEHLLPDNFQEMLAPPRAEKGSGEDDNIVDKESALAMLHSAFNGHMKGQALYEHTRQLFPELHITHDDCKDFVHSCPTCQKTNPHMSERGEHPGQPLSFHKPLAFWQMDHLYIGLDDFGYQYILNFKDCMTKYNWACATRSTDAREAAMCILDWSMIFGAPIALGSDAGSGFVGDVINELVNLFNIRFKQPIPGRPQAMGIVERANQESLKFYRAMISEDPQTMKSWSSFVKVMMRAINNSYDSSIRAKPSDIVFGLKVDLDRGFTHALEHKHQALHFRELTQQLAEMVERANKYLAQRDAKRHPSKPDIFNTSSFKKGERVLVLHKNDKRPHKMATRAFGPMKVIEQKGSGVYVQEMARNLSHFVHVNRVIPFDSSRTSETEQIELAARDHALFTIESIVSHRKIKVDKEQTKDNIEVLVRWTSGDDSWHGAKDLQQDPKFIEYARNVPWLAKLFGIEAGPITTASFETIIAAVSSRQGVVVAGNIMPADANPETEADKAIQVDILIDSGANRVNTINKATADKLVQQGVTTQVSDIKLRGHDGHANNFDSKIEGTIYLSFRDKSIAINDSFIIVPTSNHDVILGDAASAKAGLLTSAIPEIQAKLDQLADKSTARIRHDILKINAVDLDYEDQHIALPRLNQDDFSEQELPLLGVFPEHVKIEPARLQPMAEGPEHIVPVGPDKLFKLSDSDLEAIINKGEDDDVKAISINKSLTNRQLLIAKALLTQYQQHFQLFQTKLGSHLVDVPKMKIEFKDEHIHAESSCYPRAVSPEGDKIIRENLSELLQAACIRKSLNPRIISPCHLVKYPDKKDRFVIGKCQ